MAYAQPRLSPQVEAQSKRPTDLHLSNMPLPRFHPANFPGANAGASSSNISTPSTTGTSAPPLSPRILHSPYSPYTLSRPLQDGQRPLYGHREALSMLHSGPYSPLRNSPSGGFRVSRPTSPRLDPLGSPGPVTPLELEDEQDGYLFGAGPSVVVDGKPLSDKAKEDIVDSYIRKETLSRHALPNETSRQSLSPRSSHVGVKRGDVTRHRSNLSR